MIYILLGEDSIIRNLYMIRFLIQRIISCEVNVHNNNCNKIKEKLIQKLKFTFNLFKIEQAQDIINEQLLNALS